MSQPHTSGAPERAIEHHWRRMETHGDATVKVMALFARRPKLDHPGVVHGRVNSELLRFADVARQHGIPTIAGFPICQSIPELFGRPRVLWFFLHELVGDPYFSIGTGDTRESLLDDQGLVLAHHHESEIHLLIEREAVTMTWSQAIKLMSVLRKATQSPHFYNRFGWSNGYKPVYFFIS